MTLGDSGTVGWWVEQHSNVGYQVSDIHGMKLFESKVCCIMENRRRDPGPTYKTK